jgi:hypothetical protein
LLLCFLEQVALRWIYHYKISFGTRYKKLPIKGVFYCAPGRNRTCDHLLKRELLYRLSYGRKSFNKSNCFDLLTTFASRKHVSLPSETVEAGSGNFTSDGE